MSYSYKEYVKNIKNNKLELHMFDLKCFVKRIQNHSYILYEH